MAGSYGHLAPPDGEWDLIENMGDAAEAVEQLLWLVHRAIGDREARRLLNEEFYPMVRGERPGDDAFKEMSRAMGDPPVYYR